MTNNFNQEIEKENNSSSKQVTNNTIFKTQKPTSLTSLYFHLINNGHHIDVEDGFKISVKYEQSADNSKWYYFVYINNRHVTLFTIRSIREDYSLEILLRGIYNACSFYRYRGAFD